MAAYVDTCAARLSPAAPTPVANPVVPAWDQCGGAGGSCTAGQCADAAWPGQSCQGGFCCNRHDNWWVAGAVDLVQCACMPC